MPQDNQIASVANILVANGKMSDEQAYKIVKAIFDHKEELIRTHQEYATLSDKDQKSSSTPIPYHPGAAKYLKEKGVSLD